MRTKAVVLTLVMGGLASNSALLGQEVFFEISPRTAPINVNPGNLPGPPTPRVVVAQPGTALPYDLSVFVQPTPAFPNVGGLGGFNLDILTTLGLPQPPLTSFDSRALQIFVVNTSLGFPFEDDILDISGAQNLAGITNTGVGVGAWQVLGSGELILPNVEGDFEVVTGGTAEVLNTAINPFNPVLQPVTVGQAGGLIVQTRVEVPDTQPANGDDQDFTDVGVNIVNVCFPGVVAFLPACLAGLVGLRYALHRSLSRS